MKRGKDRRQVALAVEDVAIIARLAQQISENIDIQPEADTEIHSSVLSLTREIEDF